MLLERVLATSRHSVPWVSFLVAGAVLVPRCQRLHQEQPRRPRYGPHVPRQARVARQEPCGSPASLGLAANKAAAIKRTRTAQLDRQGAFLIRCGTSIERPSAAIGVGTAIWNSRGAHVGGLDIDHRRSKPKPRRGGARAACLGDELPVPPLLVARLLPRVRARREASTLGPLCKSWNPLEEGGSQPAASAEAQEPVRAQHEGRRGNGPCGRQRRPRQPGRVSRHQPAVPEAGLALSPAATHLALVPALHAVAKTICISSASAAPSLSRSGLAAASEAALPFGPAATSLSLACTRSARGYLERALVVSSSLLKT